jgi:hypothetical protein
VVRVYYIPQPIPRNLEYDESNFMLHQLMKFAQKWCFSFPYYTFNIQLKHSKNSLTVSKGNSVDISSHFPQSLKEA